MERAAISKWTYLQNEQIKDSWSWLRNADSKVQYKFNIWNKSSHLGEYQDRIIMNDISECNIPIYIIYIIISANIRIKINDIWVNYMLLIYYINHYLGKYQDSEIRKKSAAAWALLIINFLADLTFLINHKGIQRGDNSFSKLIGTNKGKENILPIKPPCFVSASFIFLWKSRGSEVYLASIYLC